MADFVKIQQHPLYEISKDAIIRNSKTLYIKKQCIGNHGYYVVSLQENDSRLSKLVHRLLMQTFVPNPNNYPYINHKDGDKLNNNLENLEWCSPKHNNDHAFKTGLINNVGQNHGMAKLTDDNVRDIRKMIADKVKMRIIAEKFNVSYFAIHNIRYYNYWSHIK